MDEDRLFNTALGVVAMLMVIALCLLGGCSAALHISIH